MICGGMGVEKMKTETLRTDPATVMFPANVHAAMTGAWKLTITGGTATLHYTDGQTESVPSSVLPDGDNWLAIVSKVQSVARAAIRKATGGEGGGV